MMSSSLVTPKSDALPAGSDASHCRSGLVAIASLLHSTPTNTASVNNNTSPSSTTSSSSCSTSRPTATRLSDDMEFRSRLSSWSNKQHQDQSKAGILIWIRDNFETGCRESIAKEDVYRQYTAHCKEEGSEPLRASMFGKLVHRAFPGLKSSRIGTRGATRHSYKSFRQRVPNGPSATSASTSPTSRLVLMARTSPSSAHQQQQPQAHTAPVAVPRSQPRVVPQPAPSYHPAAAAAAHHYSQHQRQYYQQQPQHYNHHYDDEGMSSSELSSDPSSPASSSFSIPSDDHLHDMYSYPPASSNNSSLPFQHHSHGHHFSHPPTSSYPPHYSGNNVGSHRPMGHESSYPSSPSSSFLHSPGMPFDSFSYTSSSFPTAAATSAASHGCDCDECTHLAAASTSSSSSRRQNNSSSSSNNINTYQSSPYSYYALHSATSYGGLSSAMVRRHQMMGGLEDFSLFRDAVVPL